MNLDDFIGNSGLFNELDQVCGDSLSNFKGGITYNQSVMDKESTGNLIFGLADQVPEELGDLKESLTHNIIEPEPDLVNQYQNDCFIGENNAFAQESYGSLQVQSF